MSKQITEFLRLMKNAGAVTLDDVPLLSDCVIYADVTGNPDNEIANFSWTDGEHDFSQIFTEGGISEGVFDAAGKFVVEDSEGDKCGIKFFALAPLLANDEVVPEKVSSENAEAARLSFLEDFGYCVEKDVNNPNAWIWMSPSDESTEAYKTSSEAVDAAWVDAVDQTLSISGLTNDQWEQLTFKEMKSHISDVLFDSSSQVQSRESNGEDGQKLITIDLSVFDDSGNVVDGTTSKLTRNQISDIIYHASQLIIVHESGKNIGSVLAELKEALVVADVIGDAPKAEPVVVRAAKAAKVKPKSKGLSM